MEYYEKFLKNYCREVMIPLVVVCVTCNNASHSFQFPFIVHVPIEGSSNYPAF